MSPVELVHVTLIAVAAVAALLPGIFLATIAIASLGKRRVVPALVTRDAPMIALLIPAHDEAHELERTLKAIAGSLDAGIRVHVVADNCNDATASVGFAGGACVHVREDRSHGGKAAALNWLTAQVLREDPDVDGIAILDADARPDPGFFDELRRELASGADVVQAANLVQTSDAPLTRLRDLAFHLKCEVRPLGYDRLGVSAGLHGNGICFRREIAVRFRWDDRSVVEDGELHLRLVRAGLRVRFAPRAVVRSTMPDRFVGAAGQALRWERGKGDLFRDAARLAIRGIARRSPTLVVAGLDAMIPPLSFVIMTGVLAAAAGIAIDDPLLGAAGLLALAGTAVYVARGAALARIAPRAYVGLIAWAIPYVSWKVAIYLGALAGSGRGRWAQARPALTTLSPAAQTRDAK